MAEPIVIEELTYWKLRTRLLEQQEMVRRHKADFEDSSSRLQTLLSEAGLDPGQNYKLTDESLSASVVESDAGR